VAAIRNPWELARPEWSVEVKFGGTTEQYIDEHNRLRVRWCPQIVNACVRHAHPRLSHNSANTCGCASEAPESFDSPSHSGDYYGA